MELQNNYLQIMATPEFQKELDELLRQYAGRPTPLYFAKRLSEEVGAKVLDNL